MRLDLSRNGASLGGPLPRSLGELDVLKALNLSNNRFTGAIPDVVFSRLRCLELLDLSSNDLSGSLPAFDWSSYALRDAAARTKATAAATSDRALDAAHPLARLALLKCSHNRLSGPLPTWFRTLPAIRVLELHGNRFSGNLAPLLLPPPAAAGKPLEQPPAAFNESLSQDLLGRGSGLGSNPFAFASTVSFSSDGGGGGEEEEEEGPLGGELVRMESRPGSHWDATTVESTQNESFFEDEASFASTLTPSRAPPLLLDYVRTVFVEHDVNRDGRLHWPELWWLFKGLGLGLTDAEIGAMQADANARGYTQSSAAAAHDALTFDAFAPLALTLLQRTFDSRQWGRVADGHNPWLRLHDDVTGGGPRDARACTHVLSQGRRSGSGTRRSSMLS